MTANGTPQAGARQLQSLRRRAFVAANKAVLALLDEAGEHRDALASGGVPPVTGLRRLADKYFTQLTFLDVIDSVLTPEALEAVANCSDGLEAMTAEDAVTVSVDRDALAMLTDVLRDSGLIPAEVDENTPLGQLISAARGELRPREIAELAAAPPDE
jgi:hypothetical protein